MAAYILIAFKYNFAYFEATTTMFLGEITGSNSGYNQTPFVELGGK